MCPLLDVRPKGMRYEKGVPKVAAPSFLAAPFLSLSLSSMDQIKLLLDKSFNSPKLYPFYVATIYLLGIFFLGMRLRRDEMRN